MKKIMVVIIGIGVISILLNVVMVKNIKNVEEEAFEKSQSIDKEHNEEMRILQGQVELLEEEINNQDPEVKKELSKTEIEKQNEYKEVATLFVNNYLDYNNTKLQERRESIENMVTEELIDRIAPVESENENPLSSDPTFTSSVNEFTTYIAEINEESNSIDAIIDVSYNTESSEGDAEVRALMFLEMKKNEEDKIIITSYSYHPFG